MIKNKIVSPCISICKTDPITGYCYGCARTDQEKKQVVTSRQVKPMIILNGVGTIEGTTEYSRKEVPVSHIKITANLDPDTVYNRPTYKSKVRQIESEQASSIALEGVEVVKSITKDGIVYSPIYVDGKLTFKEDDKLTVLARDAKKYKGMGLNEWGIDVNTDSWGVALRAPKSGLRAAQERPKSGQERPKSGPRAAKSGPRTAKSSLRQA